MDSDKYLTLVLFISGKLLQYIRTPPRLAFEGWSVLTELHPGICKLLDGIEESMYVSERRTMSI